MLERTTERAPKPQVAAPTPAATAPTPTAPAARLQEGAGNRAVVDLLGAAGIQAKLLVGAVHDPAEAEADRVADRVLRTIAAAPRWTAPERPPVARRFLRRAAPAPAAPARALNTTAFAGAARDGGRRWTLTSMTEGDGR